MTGDRDHQQIERILNDHYGQPYRDADGNARLDTDGRPLIDPGQGVRHLPWLGIRTDRRRLQHLMVSVSVKTEEQRERERIIARTVRKHMTGSVVRPHGLRWDYASPRRRCSSCGFPDHTLPCSLQQQTPVKAWGAP